MVLLLQETATSGRTAVYLLKNCIGDTWATSKSGSRFAYKLRIEIYVTP